MYKDYATVADGVGKQIDACISAIDAAQNGKKNPPAELEQLVDRLTEAGELCGRIESKAADEPEPEDEAATDSE